MTSYLDLYLTAQRKAFKLNLIALCKFWREKKKSRPLDCREGSGRMKRTLGKRSMQEPTVYVSSTICLLPNFSHLFFLPDSWGQSLLAHFLSLQTLLPRFEVW